MKVPEEIQTEMMADMLREKMKNHKKSKPSGKKKEKNEQIVAKADKVSFATFRRKMVFARVKLFNLPYRSRLIIETHKNAFIESRSTASWTHSAPKCWVS